jgi:hypothetical protein
VAGDNDCLAILNSPDQFGETIFRFGDTDIHAQNYSQKLWPYQSDQGTMTL